MSQQMDLMLIICVPGNSYSDTIVVCRVRATWLDHLQSYCDSLCGISFSLRNDLEINNIQYGAKVYSFHCIVIVGCKLTVQMKLA